jgi:hypothetical protein
MAITLAKSFENSSTYVADIESNFTILEDEVNAILNSISGAASLSVSLGLAEIFDRDGVIGIGSYQLTNQVVSGDSFNLPAGAAFIASTFRKKLTVTAIDTSSFTTTETHWIDVGTDGTPLMQVTGANANSIYSFTWTHTTDTISNATLLVDILFDGDDYNDMLTSASKATNYTSVAARLEAIEDTLGVLGDYYAEDSAAHSGLNFGYKLGVVRNDNVVSNTAASTILMTDAVANYVEVNPTTGVVTKNTTGFTSLLIPLFIVTPSTTVAGGTIVDKRTWASLGGGGGGGGGHTQNTDTGTTSNIFTLNTDETGTPSENGILEVERGTSPNAGLRFNEATDTWQQNKGDGVWTDIGAPDLGVQELCNWCWFYNWIHSN